MEHRGAEASPELLTPPLSEEGCGAQPEQAESVKRFKEEYRVYIAQQFPTRALEARSMIELITSSPLIEQVPMSAMNEQPVCKRHRMWSILVPLVSPMDVNQPNVSAKPESGGDHNKGWDQIVNEIVEAADSDPRIVSMVRRFKGTKIPVNSYNGAIENNIDIEMFHMILRNFLCRAVSDFAQAKTWLRLHKVDIIGQAKMSHNVSRTAETVVNMAYDDLMECTKEIGVYYGERAKVIRKLTKQPSSRDLWKTLKWMDRKEFVMCHSRLQKVQQAYTLAFDFVKFALDEIEGDDGGAPKRDIELH
uniref:Proteasome activator PA28 C-terminal domain-containing protein n=2 Tax=Trichuris muris TaxID=70415 RepID=A0A5S6PZ27_TRIMR